MRLRSTAALLLALAFASVNSALAQVTTTGSIQLIVEDPQGGRLPGVTVSASAVDVVTTRQAVTNAEGVATLEALAPSANYVVKASLSGFREYTREAILVRSGQVTSIRAELLLTTMTEQVTVTGQTSPLVDTTRAVSGADITLRLTESLPTGRSYQSYLQLVPGVMPDGLINGVASGNPASRSGVNFKENSATADNIGSSTDNAYYIEGINVTDPVTGTFGANLNTEIIQEQKVITGGIPAEYVGASGLISTVITKSGSNQYSGSANYFFRNSNFVAENKHAGAANFSNSDTAFTIGGPAIANKVWGFGSFRYTNRKDDVTATDTLQFLRTAETTAKQGFAKGTYSPTQNDMITFTFLNDPQTRTADTDGGVANSRIRRREQGGNNYLVAYNRVWSRFLVEAGYNSHDTALSDYAGDPSTSRNTVSYKTGTFSRTLADEQLGGFGQNAPETRPTKQFRGSVQYQMSRHTLKGGLEWARHEDHRATEFTGPDKAQYTSIFSGYNSVSVNEISNVAGWSTRQFRSGTASDFNGFIAKINTLPNRAQFYTAYDLDSNGTITSAELNTAGVFNSTAGNPNGMINYYRSIQTAPGPQDTRVEGLSFFAQDEFALNRVTFNVGLRGEHWGHFATTGAKVFQFDWNVAPRLSATIDVKGDGTQKASAFWGRYYDPVRMDMTNFAGTATGQTRDEQVYLLNQWVTYRTRGGPTTIDGFFSPTTKTPYTDELQLQYEIDFGNNMSGSAVYYNRKTRDIFEDFDPGLYTEASAYPGNPTAPGSLFLGWDYFGWTAANHPAANFFLGTLPDSERNYNGLELSFRKRFSNSYQLYSSYSYLDATGNSISDGNADFAGDVLWLDPRAPNIQGVVAGTIKNLFKAGGSYTTKFGLELGGTLRWNSGTIVNKTQFASSRRLPVQVGTEYVYNGVTDHWIADGAIGAVQNPGWGTADVRIQYTRGLGKATGEVFLDVFNIANNQGAVRLQDLEAGSGTTKYLDEFQWLTPRNAFLGFRVRF